MYLTDVIYLWLIVFLPLAILALVFLAMFKADFYYI